jgi:hypothetical protein
MRFSGKSIPPVNMHFLVEIKLALYEGLFPLGNSVFLVVLNKMKKNERKKIKK